MSTRQCLSEVGQSLNLMYVNTKHRNCSALTLQDEALANVSQKRGWGSLASPPRLRYIDLDFG